MKYRLTQEKDLDAVMGIIEDAKKNMRAAGIDQWQDGYPSREQIMADMERGESHVWERDGEVIGTAMLTFSGDDSYDVIKNGQWLTKEKQYGTIHRIAVKASDCRIGIAGRLLMAMEEECQENGIFSLRIDTHKDNKPMRAWLVKNHFFQCGDITLKNSGASRIAYEKRLKGEEK